MGLKDRLAAAFGKKHEPAPSTNASLGDEGMPDMYAGVKSIDEDLYVAAMRLKELAQDILAESGPAPNVDAIRRRILDSGNKAGADWIRSEFTMPAFLTDAYSKSWSDSPAGNEMVEAVAKAMAVSDGPTSKALQQGTDLIAIASTGMLVHGFFTVARDPNASTATRKTAEAAAMAKTYVLGL